MMIQTELDIKEWIHDDEWMMDILRMVRKLNLPDWWICAGFVRTKIWDKIHGFSHRTPLADIDVIYFDSTEISEEKEKQLEKKLEQYNPNLPWSVKNQARMHVLNNFPPYESSADGIAHFPETATALGVKLHKDDSIVLCAPWGIKDAVFLEVKPTPPFKKANNRHIYEARIKQKKWHSVWDKLRITE
ncbi:nucleotidyltransferase family protein [Niallia sp. MER 6]|uniref:nucleotidyltransferase family protein n=1 Tax=Niallia sp. MER 6 TaxID=2939567 RepID=UPI00203D0814|nr:nucleotidyltransferase family protein [Niallia sp. MER 6]MCM3030731.1 nucleotidyltransferase family protein [Niallia sp. MER 6]